jgi:hypothetical protein
MAYSDEFHKSIINVGTLWQEKATSRAEFMEEIQFLILDKRAKDCLYMYINMNFSFPEIKILSQCPIFQLVPILNKETMLVLLMYVSSLFKSSIWSTLPNGDM